MEDENVQFFLPLLPTLLFAKPGAEVICFQYFWKRISTCVCASSFLSYVPASQIVLLPSLQVLSRFLKSPFVLRNGNFMWLKQKEYLLELIKVNNKIEIWIKMKSSLPTRMTPFLKSHLIVIQSSSNDPETQRRVSSYLE